MEALEICKRPVVLFDFDGTVADTGRAVMTSTRKTLAARGFSEAQMGDLRRMIGPPLWKSFHDFYGFSREESFVVADEYRAFFDELGPEEYPVFDGIPELLDGLTAQGKRMAVATSRMEAKCIDMVHELGLCRFEAVVGMNPPQGRETKADSVRDALAAWVRPRAMP
ncbi:MAG: HAD hydrolase-like protein [Collinsella sp.]